MFLHILILIYTKINWGGHCIIIHLHFLCGCFSLLEQQKQDEEVFYAVFLDADILLTGQCSPTAKTGTVFCFDIETPVAVFRKIQN